MAEKLVKGDLAVPKADKKDMVSLTMANGLTLTYDRNEVKMTESKDEGSQESAGQSSSMGSDCNFSMSSGSEAMSQDQMDVSEDSDVDITAEGDKEGVEYLASAIPAEMKDLESKISLLKDMKTAIDFELQLIKIRKEKPRTF